MSSSMKDFLDNFFDLCREYQQEIQPPADRWDFKSICR